VEVQGEGDHANLFRFSSNISTTYY